MADSRIENGRRKLDHAFKVLVWSIGLYVSGMTAAQGWLFTQIIGHEVRVSKIESNRFTSKDANSLMDKMLAMQRDLEIPPHWFLKRVEKLETKVEEHKHP